MAKIYNSIQRPLTSADMMPVPIQWNPMSDDWKQWIDSHQVYNDAEYLECDKETLDIMKALHDRILSFGGDEVCMTAFNDDDEIILSRGQFFYGKSRLHKGEPQQCHYNSAKLWYENRGRCNIATGYALSKDGLWRSHSWVVVPKPRSIQIVETTVKRVAYFGVVLNDEECEKFLFTV